MRDDETVRELGRVPKNARAEYVVSERVHHGQARYEIRLHEKDGRQAMVPTRHAMALTRKALNEIIALIREPALDSGRAT